MTARIGDYNVSLALGPTARARILKFEEVAPWSIRGYDQRRAKSTGDRISTTPAVEILYPNRAARPRAISPSL